MGRSELSPFVHKVGLICILGRIRHSGATAGVLNHPEVRTMPQSFEIDKQRQELGCMNKL